MVVVRAPVLRGARQRMVVEEVHLAAPGPGEVMVRMVASGVCHSCLHVLDGSVTGAPMPIVLGDEGAGVVVATGAGVVAPQTGDHVVVSWAPSCGRCRMCVSGRPVLCLDQPPFGFLEDGTTRMSSAGGGPVHHFGPSTYAPAVVVPAVCAVPIRRDMPLDLAALIGCSVTTGVGAVLNTAAVRPGQSVAVVGCGGVGLNVVQGAALSSAAPVVAVDLSEEKLAAARRLGATHGVLADGADPAKAVLSLVPLGVDVAFVAVGSGRAVELAWRCVAPGGTVVVLGIMPEGTRIDVDWNRLMGQEVRLVGSRYGSARPSVDFPTMVELYLGGRLRLDELVTRRIGLDEINEAHDLLASGSGSRTLLVFDDADVAGL